MKLFGKVLMVLAFVLSIALAGLIYVYLKDQQKPVAEIPRVQVLVSKAMIPARTKIDESQLTWVAVEKASVPDGVALKLDEVVGLYSKDALYPNEPIRLERLVKNPDEELSMRLLPGFRAISIELTQAAGVSNLVKVGDFVDFLLFLPELKDGDRVLRPNIEKLVFQNFEVLAIEQNLFRKDSVEDKAAPQPSMFTVTLAVPVNQLEKLALAEDVGEFKMVLRPLEQDFIYPTKGAIWEELLLNDSAQMKDLFPAYDVETTKNTPLVLAGNEQIEKYIYYTVKPGDTLRSISAQFFGSEARYLLLKQINAIEDENMILTGTGIRVPVFKK